jgi:hypothetical protein
MKNGNVKWQEVSTMLKSLLPLMISLLILAACSWNPNGEYHAQREDIDGTKLMTYDRDKGFYDRNLKDEQFTYDTNQNPNFVDLAENRPDIGDDQDKFREVVDKYTEFEPGSVIINGNDAWVTVWSKRNLSEKEKVKLTKDLRYHLMKAMPRYDIHINIRND